MAQIQVLVLGNRAFAKKLSQDLVSRKIDHKIDEDAYSDAYDICVTTADEQDLEKVNASKCKRVWVFNGVAISNSTLKKMVRMRINGFLENHEDPSPIVAAITSICKTKETVDRLNLKLVALSGLCC
jgi:hypothetical protein